MIKIRIVSAEVQIEGLENLLGRATDMAITESRRKEAEETQETAEPTARRGRPPKAAAAAPPTPSEDPFAPAAATPPAKPQPPTVQDVLAGDGITAQPPAKITIDTVRAKAVQFCHRHGLENADAIAAAKKQLSDMLQARFGIASIGALEESQYADFCKAVTALEA